MVKSKVSCFNLITCGSDSVDNDDLQSPQIKGSSGRAWSFRKKSPRHRVLSNTVILEEASSSAKKESPESAVNFQLQPNLSVVPETTSVLSAQLEPKESSGDTAAKEDDVREDATVDESSIIVIQAAVRGMLARKVLLKQKNIIKLQAAVRGHLVRKHAVGTLRCVQAIIKMQALVRTRRAHVLVEQSGGFEKSEKQAKPNGTSIQKLLSNKFARQIMESTPMTKPINIKCDPAKSDSAWKWLERWMSVSSVGNDEQQEKEHIGHSESKNVILVPSESTDLKSGVGASNEASENDDNSLKSVTLGTGHPNQDKIDESFSTYDTTESAPSETKKTGSISNLEGKTLPDKEETDSKIVYTEPPETEAKKFSRSASNPSFVAAQSKFEELSSTGTSAKLTTSSSLDKVSSSTDKPFMSKEIGLAQNNYISDASSVKIVGSESGTEISISSALDALDRSEIEVKNRENLGLEASGKGTDSSMYVASSQLDPSDQKLELEFEASPRSHVSVKSKKSTGEKSDRSGKINRSSSANKKSHSNPTEYSASRSSLETGKRRNSMGTSAKPDLEEAKDNSSSITSSLPSYMQATKSAKAKAIANGSPRSSPDVHENDIIYVKKRHSLPAGTNKRHGSPRIERSLSQAQRNHEKGIGTNSPQDRKWRW
ncbi:hypothetical protein ACJIZ3_002704 [Penstemon smallii]|uniref:DUF4005 domain-containing protein n=1 Tax=Penstemon smallii TaxID=265156 RepID=A0ABD3U790_9LAMI